MEGEDRFDAAVGSVAEEAARLLESLRRQYRPDEPEPEQEEHVHVRMGDAEACSYCPVCRGIVLLRGVSPQTLDRLADLATAAAAVLADLAAARTGGGTAGPEPPAPEPIDVVDEED